MNSRKQHLIRFLRWTERYTKTDMVYLAQAGFWSNLNFVLVSVYALILSIAFANLLPKDVYGLYQYLIALSSIFGALTLGGMNSAVTQSVARGFEGDLRASVRIQLFWSLIPTSLGFFLALYYGLHGNSALAQGIMVIAILSPFINTFNTFIAFINGKRDFKTLFIFSSIINASYYPAMLLAIVLVKDSVFLVLVNLGANALANAYLYRRTLRLYSPNDRTDPATIKYGMHLSAMNAFWTVVTQLDSVLVFHFLGATELAIYSFATMLPERAGGLFKFVSAAALPKFANQSGENIRATVIQKNIRALFAGIAASVAYILVAPFFFRVLFPSYMDALFYSQVYAIVIATYATNLSLTALAAKRRQKELYVYNIVNPLVLLVLQVPMLLSFGILGILIARVISNALNVVLATILVFYPLSGETSDSK